MYAHCILLTDEFVEFRGVRRRLVVINLQLLAFRIRLYRGFLQELHIRLFGGVSGFTCMSSSHHFSLPTVSASVEQAAVFIAAVQCYSSWE